MVRQALVVVLSSLATFGCATTQVSEAKTPPVVTEIRFAGGALRTTSPGPTWLSKRDAIVLGPNGSRAQFELMLLNGKTGTTIAVKAYPTAAASPVMMADRMATGMASSGATVSDVDFSVEDGSRASFGFASGDGGNTALGKSVTRKLNENVSVAVIATWSPAAAADEAAVDALIAAIAIVPAAP